MIEVKELEEYKGKYVVIKTIPDTYIGELSTINSRYIKLTKFTTNPYVAHNEVLDTSLKQINNEIKISLEQVVSAGGAIIIKSKRDDTPLIRTRFLQNPFAWFCERGGFP